MNEVLKDYYENGKYTEAAEYWDSQQEVYSFGVEDCLIIAACFEALGNRTKQYEALVKGIHIDYTNYELYYSLAIFYADENVDKAFLFAENALFYCEKKENSDDLFAIKELLQGLGEVSGVKPVSIIIVSYNLSYMLQKNLERIKASLPADSYEIIVVDNNSTDGIAELLSERSDIKLLLNKTNEGFPKACNQGVLLAKKDNDILLLNNDTRLGDNALFNMRLALYDNELVGGTGGISNYAGNNQELDIDFNKEIPMPEDYLDYAAFNNSYVEMPYEERVRLSGFAFLIKRKAWDLSGGFDESFSPGYFEDDDLSMKIQKLGFKLLLCKNSYIYHAGSQSFAKDPRVEDYLTSHYRLFIEKYGFPILEYAYPNSQIDKSLFIDKTVLFIDAGLAADIRNLPCKMAVGIESNPKLREILNKRFLVFDSINELKQKYSAIRFDSIIIGNRDKEYAGLKELLAENGSVYRSYSFNNEDYFVRIVIPDLSKIKLVIWDMDETFWKGTLSEGTIYPIDRNLALVKALTDRGIVNSVSSKNNREDVLNILSRLNIAGFFVFNSISWDNKGMAIRSKLKAMKLRSENVLFIDDNPSNLSEASYFNEGLMTASPLIIDELVKYVSVTRPGDPSHKRLLQYRLLEQKEKERAKYEENGEAERFLYESNIRVLIEKDCENELERIEELIGRTNQLNFTKKRIDRKELTGLINSPLFETGYVKVEDRFGTYGIVGFYALNAADNELSHFLFSCRILGMGVEQYVYSQIGYPKLTVCGDVAVSLNSTDSSPWINNSDIKFKQKNTSLKNTKGKILLKGPCDLSAIEGYLQGPDIVSEFNFVNEEGFITAGQNHSMHIREGAELSRELLERMLLDVPFILHEDFESCIFDGGINVLVYSLLPDCHAGLYRHRELGTYISFGSKNFDMTKEENFKGYIEGSLPNHGYAFSEQLLREFKEKWEFMGCMTEEMIIDNLEFIRNRMDEDVLLITVLGSEKEYDGEESPSSLEFANHAGFHKKVNEKVKIFAENHKNVKIINATDFIKDESDLEGCTNHYSRSVYYNMATELSRIIMSAL